MNFDMKWLTLVCGGLLLLAWSTSSYLDQIGSKHGRMAAADRSAAVSFGQGQPAPGLWPWEENEKAAREKADAVSSSLPSEGARPALGGGFVPEGRSYQPPPQGRTAFERPESSRGHSLPKALGGRLSAELPARRVEIRSLQDQDQLMELEIAYDQLDRPTFGSFGRRGNPFLDSSDSAEDRVAGEDKASGSDSASPLNDQPAREDPPAADDPLGGGEDAAGGEVDSAQGDSNEGSGESDQADQSNGDEGNAGDEPPPPEDPPAQDEASPPRQEPVAFDFLVARPPSFPDERYSLRAKRGRDGLFLLENEEVWSFSQFQLRQSASVFDDSQMLFTDIDGDGRSDLVLGRNGEQGAQVHILYRKEEEDILFEEAGVPILLRGETINSLALFDFDEDGMLDVAAVLEGRPSLLILTLQEESLKVVGDLALAFQPGLVIDWRGEHPLVAERRLYVYDSQLERAAVVSSFQPRAVFEFTLESGKIPPPRFTKVNWHPEESTSRNKELLIFESRHRSIILEATPSGVFQLYVNLDISTENPLAIVGDFFSRGSRSIIVVH